MAIPLIEIKQGRLHVNAARAALLFAGLLTACTLAPMALLWLAFGNARLVENSLETGFTIAAAVFGAILGRSLRLALKTPPGPESDFDA